MGNRPHTPERQNRRQTYLGENRQNERYDKQSGRDDRQARRNDKQQKKVTDIEKKLQKGRKI
jgi:hypothetical protein